VIALIQLSVTLSIVYSGLVMKEKYYRSFIKYMVLIGDVILLWISCQLSEWILTTFEIPYHYQSDFFIIFTLAWLLSGLLNKIYRINKLSSVREIATMIFGTSLIHMIIIMTIINTIQPTLASVGFLWVNYFIVINLVIWSRVSLKLGFKYVEFTAFDKRRVIIVGTTHEGHELQNFFQRHKGAGYEFLGFFDNELRNGVDKADVKGGLNDIEHFCLENGVEEVYFALPLEFSDLLYQTREFCDRNTIYFRFAPDFSDLVKANYHVFLYDSLPVITMRNEPLGCTINLMLKRAFDIIFSLLVILFIFPFVFTIIAIAIKLDSPGPILFKQLRPGKRNRLFECYKFRTMYVNDETELQATKNDSRVTKVGKILRKTNLDELPQFFNVLLGSMSVVGPRPNLISQLDKYSKIIDKYKVRHFITPGITGYAQVNGFRGETREKGLMEKRVEYDVKYIENWSFLLDLKIIIKTVTNMIKGEKNAY